MCRAGRATGREKGTAGALPDRGRYGGGADRPRKGTGGALADRERYGGAPENGVAAMAKVVGAGVPRGRKEAGVTGWSGWSPAIVAGVAVAVAAAAALGAMWWRRRGADQVLRRGDIWWADVPFADGTGAKLRPCLIVRGGRRRALVLKITSQDKSHRRDHILIPTREWDPWARRDSYLNLGEPIKVDRGAFQRRVGRADPATLRRVAQRR